MNDKKTPWHEVYTKLAKLLAEFGKDNPSPGQILLESVLEDKDFLKNNDWINRNLKRARGSGLDPIQIFTSFSRPKQNDKNRVDRLNSYFRLLAKYGSESYEYQEIDFSGCPTPLGLIMASFRLPQQQSEIWKAFLQIMREGKTGLTREMFGQVKKWYGVDVPSFTIFLFWIDSANFLPLDAYTANYIESNRRSRWPVYSFDGYVNLLVASNTTVYRSIAVVARDPTRHNEMEMLEIRRYFGLGIEEKLAVFPYGCQLLGVRADIKCSSALRKVLNPGELYQFNEAYDLESDPRIVYHSDKDIGLYRKGDLFLEVNAVVGKNGAGKSSLVELLLAVFNNIACKKREAGEFKSDGDFEPQEVEGLVVDVYIKALTVCKIVVKDDKISITEYRHEGNVFTPRPARNVLDYPISGLFYTAMINYSLYALNSTQDKPWLKALFHKNDAYQFPIVLDPFRKEGDIQVNVQTRLAKSRLQANLLEPRSSIPSERGSEELNFRKLTDFQEAVTLKLCLIKSKVEYVYKKKKLKEIEGHLQIVRFVQEIFGIKKNIIVHIGRETMEGRALTYIVRKLYSMSRTYPAYKDFKARSGIKNVKQFLIDIRNDPSHMAFKIKQAINYLKFNYLPKKEQFNKRIDRLSDRIEERKKRDNSLKTIHMTPPSFFDVDIEMKSIGENGLVEETEKATLFNELSSGEKQQIFSINSIIYHLRNIHSLFEHPDETLIRYPYVLLVCDEIELYFHPELQRKFLSTLLKAIASIDLSNIRGINLLFVTHSPFILSDIAKANILFLKKEEGQRYATSLNVKPDTFGANIHELLSDGFFMSNTIGAFAKEKITEIIEFCKDAEAQRNRSKVKTAYEQRKERFNFIADNIGEGYIKGILKNHIQQLEELIGQEDVYENRIRRLKGQIDELEKLQNAKNTVS